MIAAYRWDSNWKIVLLVALMVPVLLRLGFWQLERGEEKQLLQNQFERQSQLAPVALAALDFDAIAASGQPNYQTVVFSGRFDNEKLVLLDNRIYEGAVGYHALMPFTTTDGQSLLVNRGWLAGNPDRRQLPALAPVDGEVELLGKLYIPLGEPVLLGTDSWAEGWPVVVQWENIEGLAERLALPLLPYSVRLEPGSVAALVSDWPAINTQPEKHRGYAVQWFLMAAAVTAFWLYSSIRPARESK